MGRLRCSVSKTTRDVWFRSATASTLCLCAWGTFRCATAFPIDTLSPRPAVLERVLQSSNTPTVVVNTTLLHTAYPLDWPTNYNGSQPYVSADNQTTAVCLHLSLGDWWSFECQNCTQPLALLNTSGIAFDIAQLEGSGNGRFSVKPTFFLPPVDVVLQDTNGDILCTMPMGSDSVVHPNFFFHASSLFQNYPSEKLEDCRAILHKATAVGFQAFTTTSFCVDNLQLLTSNVVTGSDADAALPLPFPNCYSDEGHNTTMAGNFTDLSWNLSSWAKRDIFNPGLSPRDSYIASIGIASPTANLLYKTDQGEGQGSCSIIQFQQLDAINSCAKDPKAVDVNPYWNACCFKTAAYQDGPNATLLPQLLADMCSKIVMPVGDSLQRCVGFDYKYDLGLAYFKTSSNGQMHISGSTLGPAWSACARPNTVFWEQNSAVPGYVPSFTNISNSIYSNGLGTGWSVGSASSSIAIALQQAGAGLQGSNGLCVKLNETASQGEPYDIQFFGQDSGIANHPFAANNSALHVWMSIATYSSSTGAFTPDGSWPAIQMQLLDANKTHLCNLPLSSPPGASQNSSLQYATAAFEGCNVLDLAQAASLGVIFPASLGSVCLDGLTLGPPNASAAAPTAAGSVSPSAAVQRASGNGLGTGEIVGIALTLLGFAVAVLTWLTVLGSYRASKRSIVMEVVQRVRHDHISVMDDPEAASTMAAAGRGVSDSAHKRPSIAELAHDSASQVQRQATGLQRATSTTPLTANAAVKDSAAVSAAAAAAAAPPSLQEVQRVAKEITQHCLSRWDAWLGLKAGSDSTGGKTGIWRVKFDGVRCAVLLLAFHKLNKELQGQQDSPATLFQAWHNRKLLHQLVQRVAEILQDVDKLEAQALPDKDPEFVNAPNAIWAAARRWLHH